MPLSSLTQQQILQYYFQGRSMPPLGLLYVGLHSAAPGADGAQNTNETVYAGYARLPVAPSQNTFLVSPGPPARAQNLSTLSFPACTGAGDTLAFWSLGTMPSGAGQILTYGPLGPGTVYGFSGLAGAPSPLFVPALPAGIVVNSTVVLAALGPGVLLPLGLVDGQVYYVGAVSGSSLTLSTTLNNGSPVAATAPGSGYLLPCTPLVVAQGNVPTFPPNSLLTFQG